MRSAYALSFAAAAVALPAPQASSSTETICPAINNTIAQSNNFQYYELHCGKWIDSDPIYITETEVGYAGCLTACDGTVGCGAVEYTATDFNQTYGSCTVFPASELKDGSSNSWTVAVPLGWNGTTAANETSPPSTTEPAAAEPTRFYGLAIRSGSDIQYASVAANGLQFWLNKNTSTYCPDVVGVNCPDNTASTIFAHGVNSTTLSLDVSVPGGQQVYVAADGLLKFTQAHSAFTGDNSTTTGFSINSDEHLQFENNDFLACPTGNSTYEVRASQGILGTSVAQGCLGFAFRVEEAAENAQSAWQYA